MFLYACKKTNKAHNVCNRSRKCIKCLKKTSLRVSISQDFDKKLKFSKLWTFKYTLAAYYVHFMDWGINENNEYVTVKRLDYSRWKVVNCSSGPLSNKSASRCVLY